MSSVAGSDVADLDSFFGDTKEEVDKLFEDETLPDAPAVELLDVMRTFSHDYAKKLGTMREALSDSLSEAWQETNDVIQLSTSPYDSDHLVHIVRTENQQLNKVTLVFSTLCSEMITLRQHAENTFYAPLTMFGHEFAESDSKKDPPADPTTEGPEHAMGAFLPFLQDMTNYITRVHSLIRNCINQLSCLYHERQKLYLSTFRFIHLEYVFETMGELMRVLVTMDAIIADNAAIATGWSAYKRMIKYIRSDPNRYGVEQTKLRTFETLLLQLDRSVLTGNIFEGLLNQEYGLPGGQSSKALVAGNRALADTFVHVIRAYFRRLTVGLGDSVETYERERLVDCLSLYCLYRRLFRATTKPDKKWFNELWIIQKRVPMIVLYGRALWFVPDFLMRHAPIDGIKPTPALNEVVKMRTQYLQQMDETLTLKTEELYGHMCMWMVRMDSDLEPTPANPITSIMISRAKLLLNGLLLANQVRNLVTVNVHLHLVLREPFRSKNIRSLAICSEMLKAIEAVYQRRMGMIAENMNHMMAQTMFTLKRIFAPIQKKLMKKEKLNDTMLDVLAAVNLVLRVLDVAPTHDRLQVLNIALAIAQLKDILKQNHLDEVRYQVWKLTLLAHWRETIVRVCHCSYLYWVTNLVPAFFKDIFDNPDQVNRLPYLFACFRDSNHLFSSLPPAHGAKLAKAYREEVMSHFTEVILNPLAREIENDLRLHIHSVVLEQASLRNTQQYKDLSRFIELKPLDFFDTTIDVRARVTHYLDATFYNLNTVTLHDWRIYAEMRNLAHEKYGLDMTEVHLPGNAHYSEALDVLEIMRNIHIFVARYNYNMNTQIFVERAFDQKHLNTINIHHIANSIRTHGTGIMNTTVNFTYQFLVRKFVIFSEFLFDDHIKSRLLKVVRFFKQERESLNNRYPFDGADKFNRDIRKLGVFEDGSTFMDQFRLQVTEIGNALGYVRMVRSGGLHYCSAAIKFVPDLDDIRSFAEACRENQLSPQTQEAAANLDAVLEDLAKNFAEGTEYFSMLVAIFSAVFQTEQHKHLHSFYAIVPALTLNFVEKNIQQKDSLGKKSGRQEAAFSDDGFALGLAYILKLLKQDDVFDSLHWFESVNQHIMKKRQEAMTLRNKKGANEEDVQHAQLQVKRLAAIQLEFELLFYSFSGARIFFRDPAASEAPATGVEGTQEPPKPAENGAPAPAPAADGAAAAAPPPPPPPPAPSMDVASDAPMAPPMSMDIPMAPPM